MAVELADLVDPARTALCLQECQNGVIGRESNLPALAEEAAHGLIPNVARLAEAAREVGVRVVHCIAMVQPDGWGANRNARLFAAARRSPVQLLPGTAATEPVPEVGFVPGRDIVVPRFHGLSPFQGTELDALLRNERIENVVVCGVSLNVAVTNFTFDLVNTGYQVVIPTDAVVATPAGYGEAILANTLSYVATLATTATVAEIWESA